MGEPDPASVPRVPVKKRKAAGGAAPAGRTLGKVGYAIRFDDRTGPDARLRFMTDGLLLREIMGRREQAVEAGAPSHAMLERYGVIIIDEAHERTVDTDLLLGLVRRIQRARREAYDAWRTRQGADSSMDVAPTLLKVVVMSATLDAQKFASFFAEPRISPNDGPVPAPILYVAGRQFQVDVCHTMEPQADLTAAARQTVFQIHTGLAPGDILVFSTGAEEIESLRAELERLNPVVEAHFEQEGKPGSRLHVVPLYAALGAGAIAKAFEPTPPGCRKVVIATNIAETSITLPGVQYVIDYGLAKERGLTRQGQAGGGSVSSLQALPISQSAADQRTGRAGRVSKGRCFRLYTEAAYEDLDVETVPEILRSDLTNTCLTLYSLGINPLTFDWISMPDKSEVAASTMSLYHLGAVVEPRAERRECGMEITPLGRRMVGLPLPAALARMLIAGGEMGPHVARQVRDLVAILSSDRASILHVPSQSSNSASRAAGAQAGPSDFDRAHEAHAKLAHVSGDHATQLNALYAYLDALQEAKASAARMAELGTPDAKGHKSKGQKSALHMHMKAWCRDNWISDKSLVQVLDIRRQLQQLCRAAKIICDDDATPSMPGTPRNKVPRMTPLGTPRSSGTGDASDDDSDDSHPAAGLYVTRGGARGRGAAGAEQEREDYAELRKCIFLGRSSEYAFKQNDGSYLRPGSDLVSAGCRECLREGAR
jgi:ATP-dependent RNA helicase DHX33